MDDRRVLVAVLAVLELVVVGAVVFPGIRVLPFPLFGLVLLLPLRLSRSRWQVVPVVLRRPTVAKKADWIDGDRGRMAGMTLFNRVPTGTNKVMRVLRLDLVK